MQVGAKEEESVWINVKIFNNIGEEVETRFILGVVGARLSQ